MFLNNLIILCIIKYIKYIFCIITCVSERALREREAHAVILSLRTVILPL